MIIFHVLNMQNCDSLANKHSSSLDKSLCKPSLESLVYKTEKELFFVDEKERKIWCGKNGGFI